MAQNNCSCSVKKHQTLMQLRERAYFVAAHISAIYLLYKCILYIRRKTNEGCNN